MYPGTLAPAADALTRVNQIRQGRKHGAVLLCLLRGGAGYLQYLLKYLGDIKAGDCGLKYQA